jgi:HSP20 family molecular chaperone IbpA
VARRTPPVLSAYALPDFNNLCDQMFDDLLIARWRPRRGHPGERVVAVDLGTSYQVNITTADADPHAMELEVTDYALLVRSPSKSGHTHNSCRFPHPIDCDRVTASWRDGVLQIVLPKKPRRRITVE